MRFGSGPESGSGEIHRAARERLARETARELGDKLPNMVADVRDVGKVHGRADAQDDVNCITLNSIKQQH